MSPISIIMTFSFIQRRNTLKLVCLSVTIKMSYISLLLFTSNKLNEYVQVTIKALTS